ncbi:MAG: helix-turn-helix transcriptional regulator [Oscillospiraceae bacterium]|nr:helix-turn-helix transcriptional regulator [Oscillospiraceae bacterium]
MLISDIHNIGSRLFAIRKRSGLTQAEMAEKAGISDRAYAGIERGNVNMKLETLLRICNALHITPDEILTDDNATQAVQQEYLIDRLNNCAPKERDTALRLLSVYLQSLTE